jgi:hypothetical protein
MVVAVSVPNLLPSELVVDAGVLILKLDVEDLGA